MKKKKTGIYEGLDLNLFSGKLFSKIKIFPVESLEFSKDTLRESGSGSFAISKEFSNSFRVKFIEFRISRVISNALMVNLLSGDNIQGPAFSHNSITERFPIRACRFNNNNDIRNCKFIDSGLDLVKESGKTISRIREGEIFSNSLTRTFKFTMGIVNFFMNIQTDNQDIIVNITHGASLPSDSLLKTEGLVRERNFSHTNPFFMATKSMGNEHN